jgi:DNA-binding NarL/FixJ family response regulator
LFRDGNKPAKTPGAALGGIRKTRVFLVDDHPLVREWLTNMINQQPDLVVCGEADGAPQALEAIGGARPQVAIVDLSLKSGSGLELVKNLKQTCPDVAVVVLSMHDEMLYAERVFRAGARGYVMKRESTSKVVEAIRSVVNGKRFISERVAAAMVERLVEGPPDGASPVASLTDRELEVFELLGQGKETREIAAMLHVSVKTVQAFYALIKRKLNVATERELLREAIRWHENRS